MFVSKTDFYNALNACNSHRGNNFLNNATIHFLKNRLIVVGDVEFNHMDICVDSIGSDEGHCTSREKCTVDARVMLNRLDALHDSLIDVYCENDQLCIAQNGKVIPTFLKEHTVDYMSMECNNPVSLKFSTFKRLYKHTKPAVGKEFNAFHKNDIPQHFYMHVTDNDFNFVASDTYCLTRSTVQLRASSNFSALIHQKTMSGIMTVFNKMKIRNDETVFLSNYSDGLFAVILVGKVRLCIMLNKEEYLPYKRIETANIDKKRVLLSEYVFCKDELINAILIPTTICNNSRVDLLTTSDGRAEIHGHYNGDVAFESVIGTSTGNDENAVSFNGKKMLDILKSLSERKVMISIYDDMAPIQIIPLENDKPVPNYYSCLMPLYV